MSMKQPQPPSGGCVLKQPFDFQRVQGAGQPPSGGCVLKPFGHCSFSSFTFPAAFGRLCVETKAKPSTSPKS